MGHLGHLRAAPPAEMCLQVVARLEEAGATLLALPDRGPSPRLRTYWPDFVRDASEAYGYGQSALRPATPSPHDIGRMDEALGWLALIPQDRYVLRRVVGARALVSPLTGRHLVPWQRLAAGVGADYRAVQRWHEQGVHCIVAGLRGHGSFFSDCA